MNSEEENQKLREQLKKLENKLQKVTAEKDKITAEKDKITAEKDKITAEKDKIIAEKEQIMLEKKKLEEEFNEFKAKHKQTVTNLHKALNIKANQKKKKKKKVGAPIGHKGYTRIIPARIDFIKAIYINKCPHCNSKLNGKTQEIRKRHITEIKLISKVKNTQYNIHRKYCPSCKKLVENEVPNALPNARFGLNLMLLIMYLSLGLRLPNNKIKDYLMTLYDLKISEAGIIGILKRLSVEFGEYYKYLEKLVKLAKVKHTDSTSWRVNGKNYNAWVFVSIGVVLYKIKKRNNHKVPLSIFGKKQTNNVLVIDRHSACRKAGEIADFILQYCWSHIIRNSKDLAKDFGIEGKFVHKELKRIFKLAKSIKGNANKEIIEQLKTEIFQLTLRQYNHLTIGKFVRTLYYRDIEGLFTFVTFPEVDPTNNISERELRSLVIIRKISNGSRSINGSKVKSTLLSIVQTLRMKKINILEGLQDILQNPSEY
jgi:transposase